MLLTDMQNEGETDNRKAMIMVSCDNFNTSSKSRMFIFWAFSSIYYATLHSCYTQRF